jgi:hypothetical protein
MSGESSEISSSSLEELCLATGKVLRLATPLGAYSVQDKLVPEEGG